MSKPLLLGEAPSRTGDRYHAFPLSGTVARTLCRMADIPPQPGGSFYGQWTWALYDLFVCRNVFERYAAAIPWSAPKARYAAAAVIVDEDPGVVVCLGRRVLDAVLNGTQTDFHEWVEGLFVIVGVPHPSGLNRLLNYPEERLRIGATLREALARNAALSDLAR